MRNNYHVFVGIAKVLQEWILENFKEDVIQKQFVGAIKTMSFESVVGSIKMLFEEEEQDLLEETNL